MRFKSKDGLVIMAVRIPTRFVITLDNDELGQAGQPGDWLVEDTDGWRCMVPHGIFAKYFEAMKDDREARLALQSVGFNNRKKRAGRLSGEVHYFGTDNEVFLRKVMGDDGYEEYSKFTKQ